jgi:polyamine oxidase
MKLVSNFPSLLLLVMNMNMNMNKNNHHPNDNIINNSSPRADESRPLEGKKERKKKVVIIGAGFSGLSAAYYLTQDPRFDVKILEARDRIGGRVHPFDLDGTTVDLGGQWVHEASKANPMRQLMEELDIPFQRNDNDNGDDNGKNQYNVLFDPSGEKVGRGIFRSAERLFYKALNDYELTNVSPETSFRDLLDERLQLQAASDNRIISMDEIKFQQALNYFIHRAEIYEGGRLFELSAALADLYQNKGGPDQVPEGGYNRVLQVVSERIGLEKIRLGCPIESIQYEPRSSITNEDENGEIKICLQDGDESILGDFCICTVPLGVLQHRRICFTPDLPEGRWGAIDSIGMGLLDKVVMKFETCFWGDNLKQFGLAHEDPTLVKSFYDCSSDVGAPVLFLFLGGDAARRIDSPDGLNDVDAVADAMKALRAIFGDCIPDPIASKVSRWKEDELAYGSYSFAKVGSTEGAYDEVASPIGNLMFAGEHTSKHSHSVVHGAWETGQREASRLMMSSSSSESAQ